MCVGDWCENAFGERWLKSVNGRAFAQQSSSVVFKQVFQDLFEKTDHFYLIVGSDSALLRTFVRKNYSGGRRRFLFIEPDEIYGLLEMEGEDIVPASRFSFEDLADRYPEYFTHNRFSVVRSLAVLDQLNDAYTRLWEDVQVSLKLYDFLRANIFGNRKFIDTQLYNVAFNVLPSGELIDSFSGLSAVLLGGGPTLDSGMEWVRQHQDRIVVAAVGRISKRLQQEGISPHLYASVDPNDVSYDNSKHLTQASGSVLIHTNYTHSSILAEYPGPRAFTDMRFPWQTELNPPNIMTSGPTVVNTLMGLLVHLGIERIYLLGVDFCYTPEGLTHESGSLEARQGGVAHGTDLQVETYSGRKAYTNTSFYDALQVARNFITQVHEGSSIRFYQLGRESAKIDGVPLISFDQVVLNRPERQRACVDVFVNKASLDSQRYVDYLGEAKRELVSKRKLFREIGRLAEKGLEISNRLFEDLSQLDRQTRKITRIQNRLSSDQLQWAHEFLYHYAVGNYADFLAPQEEREALEQSEIKSNLINYFSALKNTVDAMLASLDRAIEHVAVQRKAVRGEDLAEVAHYWLMNGQEGRIRLWQRWHGKTENALSDPERAWVDKLLTAYTAKLSGDQETQLARRLKESQQGLHRQLAMLHHHFESENLEGVSGLVPVFEKIKTKRSRSAAFLARGYRAELEGRAEEALEHYARVEERDMLPYSLSRIVQLALKQGNQPLALNALEILTEFDDRYFIAYADLLSALGDFGGAVLIYDHYLSRHLDDHAIWLKAAKAAISGGDHGAAAQCLREVIEKSREDALIQEAKDLMAHLPGAEG